MLCNNKRLCGKTEKSRKATDKPWQMSGDNVVVPEKEELNKKF